MLVRKYCTGASVPAPGSLARTLVIGLPKETFWATAVMSDMSASAGVAWTTSCPVEVPTATVALSKVSRLPGSAVAMPPWKLIVACFPVLNADNCVVNAPPSTWAMVGAAVIWMDWGVVEDWAATVWFMNSRFLQARYAALPPARTSRESGVTVAELPVSDTLAFANAR